MKSESLKAPLGELAMRFWMIGAAVVLCSLAQTARGADEPAGKPGKKVSKTAVDVSVFAREIDQLVADELKQTVSQFQLGEQNA